MSLATLIFLPSESFPAKVMAISSYGTFTTRNGKIYDLALVPHFDMNFELFDLWTCQSHSYLSNKILTTFLPFLVPDLQSNVTLPLLCPIWGEGGLGITKPSTHWNSMHKTFLDVLLLTALLRLGLDPTVTKTTHLCEFSG